jgi:hypothetical protein
MPRSSAPEAAAPAAPEGLLRRVSMPIVRSLSIETGLEKMAAVRVPEEEAAAAMAGPPTAPPPVTSLEPGEAAPPTGARGGGDATSAMLEPEDEATVAVTADAGAAVPPAARAAALQRRRDWFFCVSPDACTNPIWYFLGRRGPTKRSSCPACAAAALCRLCLRAAAGAPTAACLLGRYHTF